MVHSPRIQPNAQRQAWLHSALLALVFAALLLCVSALAAFSQGSFSQGTAVPFLRFPADARSHAMGRTGTGDRTNPYAAQWNIAAAAPLATSTSISISTSSTPASVLDSATDIPNNPFLWDSSEVARKRSNRTAFLAFQRPHYFSPNALLFAVSAQGIQLGAGNVVVSGKYFAMGNTSINDVVNEFSASVGYAVASSSEVSIGGQLNYIQSEFAPRTAPLTPRQIGRSLSVDIGVLYTPEMLAGLQLDKRVSVGATFKNIGAAMTYNNFADPLPTEFRVGIAADILRVKGSRLSLQGDVALLLANRRADGSFDSVPMVLLTGWRNPLQASIGAEYAINETLFFRAGYVDDSNKLTTNLQRLSFGGGFHFAFGSLDFALDVPFNQSGLASTMSVGIRL
ncbi:MAG: hypothetical protein EAZ92_00480 [Candidatus Kapaibacterium sp.]|nr:MAG: hypothetical protein EAZ92_00480 [Candidatus Kapabacteria bacterium]